jgi:1,3-beta-glucan synthase
MSNERHLLNSDQVFKYGLVYICIMAIFIALIALRELLHSTLSRSHPYFGITAAILRNTVNFDCSLCRSL